MMLIFFPVVNFVPTSVCYSTCIHFSHIIAAGPGSDKLRWWGKGALVGVECASLRSREGMPKPAQQPSTSRDCKSGAEVWLFCIWLTISELVKWGLCPPAAGFTWYFQIVYFDPEPRLHRFSIMHVRQMRRGEKGGFMGQVCDFLFIYIKGTFKSSEPFQT